MANTMRKMAEYLGLVDGEDYTESYDVVQEYVQYEEPTNSPSLRNVTPTQSREPVQATPIRPATPTGEMYRITTLHPNTYNDARRIGDEFRNGTPVIMNLGGMDESDARRIVDFSAGLVFGLNGSIEKVTQRVFLLSPANVDIGAAARAQLREDPFFNQS